MGELREFPTKQNNVEYWTNDFVCNSGGVWYVTRDDPMGRVQYVPVCSPLYILARARNIHNQDYAKLLVFIDEAGYEKTYLMRSSERFSLTEHNLQHDGLNIAGHRNSRTHLKNYLRA